MTEEKTEFDRTAIESLIAQLGVDRVYGEPKREGGVTIIPVAEVTVGLGYGYGHAGKAAGERGSREASKEPETAGDQQEAAAPGGGGGGGGAGGRVTPRGYIRIVGDRVSFEPILDVQRLALAGMLLSAWITFWLTRTVRAFARR